MRRPVLSVVCAVVAGCPAPRDTTPGIHVVPAAAGRWSALLQGGPDDAAVRGLERARVHVMKRGEELGGPNAIGRPGDLVLENDQVVFVVDQLGSTEGFTESGGNIVDAADAHVRKDELGQMFTYFGVFPRQGVYEALSSGIASDGAAWVEAKGHELYEAGLTVATRYSLHPRDRALLVETTVENSSDESIDLPSLGDAIQWGGAEKFAPGKPNGFKGPSSGPYVGGVGRFTSYAVTSTEGAVEAISGSGWTDTSQRKAILLPPREKASYSRVVVVGERPDTSSVVAELAMAAAKPVGEVEVRLPAGAVIPTGSFVTMQLEGSSEPLTVAPPFVGRLPVGRYWIAPTLSGSGGPPNHPIDIEEGRRTAIDIAVQAPAALEVHCVDAKGSPTACKLTFEGMRGTKAPDFGIAHAAGPARHQVTTSDGSSKVLLPAGAYRLTASRGPEYALASVLIDLAPGDRHSETFSLARVVDTSGYVACDFHQHSSFSADAPTNARDRVIANAAEAVEVAVASEHNVVADLEAIVREMHLENDLVEISGDELTSDASRHPWGHANVFPLSFDGSKPAGGAPRIRDRSPADVFARMRAQAPGDLVVQVNHPRAGNNGYFNQLGFDPAKGSGTEAGYAADFDAVEVWNGRNVEARAKVIDDWRALLRTGHPVTATADTDTHGIVGQEAGYPRTYVRVVDDGHFGAWDAARSADLVRGIKGLRDVVLTNGPMLRVSAGGVPIGGVARGPLVTVRVHVECAPWVDVDAVRVVRASGGGDAGNAGRAAPHEDQAPVALAALPSGARGADLSFALRFDKDDAFFVVASGKKPLKPVLDGDDREILPWAMTGAIWVDADGDGRSLGR
jgi:hypothetical protein